MSNKPLTERQARLARLVALPDTAIDTSDIPEVPDWSDAIPGTMFRPRKMAVTIRLDADLIAFFKARGGRYQTEINRALREWVHDHRKLPRAG